jgi:NADP-dependent 3-hydroxy acid dehydrogenase YdfG
VADEPTDHMPDRMQRRIFLTGATAGIGAALAEAYAADGITLGLVARREDRLEQMAKTLGAQGCRVLTYVADVCDAAHMEQVAMTFCEAAGGVDLVIANAGISAADKILDGNPAGVSNMFRINVEGVVNTLFPMVPAMVAQGSGHLVAIGSVAGFRGLPGKGGYSATKASVKILMDSYRPLLRGHGIRATTICPGFVASELTAKNPYPMPFIMPAEKAARLIQGAISRGASTYIFPWQMRMLVPLLKRVPDRMLPGYRQR